MLRSPDLRLGDIRNDVMRGTLPFSVKLAHPGRDAMIFARTGDFVFEMDDGDPVAIFEGTVVAIDGSQPSHHWRAIAAGRGGTVELFVGSVPQRVSMLQRQPSGSVIIPPDAHPYAGLLRHAIEGQIIEHDDPTWSDDSVVRRCAEICLIQLVRYQRFKAATAAAVPPALASDEHLLRAWSAYFAEPHRKWTLQALASAAGLSRTTFATRFREVFGAPPLQTLTALRLEQAEIMLRDTRAPLIEIAFTVGYNSEAAFIRAFHRQYGMPPGRFRVERAVRNGLARG